MFKDGISDHALAPGVDAGMLATTAAWAVFGAARRWLQTPDRIPAEEMAAITTAKSPREACATLVEMAKERGGHDNITVQILKVQGPAAQRPLGKTALE